MLLKILNLFLPEFCALCHRPNARNSLCKRCTESLIKNTNPCRYCALPLPDGDHICGACLYQPPLWQTAFVPFIYEDKMQFLVGQLKFHHQPHLAKTLAIILSESEPDFDATQSVIIPVPLHKKRLTARRFNQSFLLGKHIGKALNIPILNDVAYRNKNTKSQSLLNGEDRKDNVKNAFQLKNTDKITNKNIIIIDDVLTTGSTVSELCKQLIKHRPKRIDVWCVARATRDSD